MRIMGALMRPFVRRMMGRAGDPEKVRKQFETVAKWSFKTPPFARYDRVEIGGAPALWVSSGAVARDPVILYLHGGGYIAGSPETHKKLAARLSRMSGVRVFLPSYRRAPEHRVIDAVDDAIAAWNHLRSMGYDPHDVIIGGESAGGGLALSLLSHLCHAATPPRAAFAWSPFTDLSFSGLSVVENAKCDHFFPGDRVGDLTDMILGEHDPKDPRVSPLFAEFPDCPPVLLHVSDTEILRDDAMRMEEKLRLQGTDVRLQTFPNAPHAHHIFDGWFPEAREAIGLTAHFIQTHVTPQRGS